MRRAACAPRMVEGCSALEGKARRQCRRRLLRACRQTTPEFACALASGDDDGSDGAGIGGGRPGRGAPDGVVDAATAALANRLVTIGTSELFSSGTITETQEIRLCGSASVVLVVTTVTSTNVGDIAQTFISREACREGDYEA